MLDRASTFADPEIVKLLQTRFIPVAIDQAYQRRQKDNEGEFYRKIAGQGPRNNFRSTTQGLYIATASGKFLGYNNNRGSDRVKVLMKKALREFRPSSAKAIQTGKPDSNYNPKPPAGGLVVRVRARILGGYEPTNDRWQRIFQNGLSRDNFWVTKDEHQALLRDELPMRMQKRLARFHLIDNTRGEPPMWNDNEIRKLDLKLTNGKLTGTVHLETKSGDRGYQAELLGFISEKDGRVTGFDVVAKGQFWGRGPYTGNPPKGKFPLAVALSLATGKEAADMIPPQGSRGWVRGYISN